jgi:phosphoribosylaminoimidazole-succinocarboxamide synthase
MLQTSIAGFAVKRGKVRDIYELGDSEQFVNRKNELLIVTTDRISAYDHVLPNLIPDKGKILTSLSIFWSEMLDVYYHLISPQLEHLPEAFRLPELKGRTMLVEKAEVIPYECVVRGYVAGSAWKDYQKTGEVCGIKLPKGLKQNQALPTPIFTPATKAASGHDLNVSFDEMANQIGLDLATDLESKSVALYMDAADHCWQNGLILADTKFEWGTLKHVSDDLALIDEVITPDSSRFWPIEGYELNQNLPSFDKQFVRDYLESTSWDKNSPPPELPDEVVNKTREKYIEAYQMITGQSF